MSCSRLLVVLALLTTEACGGAEPGASVVVSDSSGVRIIHHRELPDQEAAVVGEPLFRVGWDREDYLWERVFSGVLLPDGGAAVGDIGASNLVVLGGDGSVRAVLGGPGSGPSEIGQLVSVSLLGADTLVVEDDGNLRITFFNGGQVRRSFRATDGPLLSGVDLDGTGGLIVRTSTFRLGFEEPWLQGVIARLDLRTERLDTLRLFDLYPNARLRGAANPFPPSGRVAVTGNGLAIGRSDIPQIVKTDRTGATTTLIRWTAEPVSLTDSIWADYEARYRAARVGRDEDEVSRILAERRSDVGELPHFIDLLGDEQGNIWVGDFSTDYEGVRDYGVFAPDGTWLGRVHMPPRLNILDIGGERILGVERNEYDVHAVVVYSVSWN